MPFIVCLTVVQHHILKAVYLLWVKSYSPINDKISIKEILKVTLKLLSWKFFLKMLFSLLTYKVKNLEIKKHLK